MLKNPSYVTAMMIFLALNASLSLMSLDEQVKWDQYALTMPVNKSLLVKEKLFLSTLFTIGGGVLSLILGVVLTSIFGGDQELLVKCTLVESILFSLCWLFSYQSYLNTEWKRADLL